MAVGLLGLNVMPSKKNSVSLSSSVGFEDEDKLTKPKAVVVIKADAKREPGPALAEELIQHARAQLVHYKVPRRIEFVATLPRSDRGKVLRREVR